MIYFLIRCTSEKLTTSRTDQRLSERISIQDTKFLGTDCGISTSGAKGATAEFIQSAYVAHEQVN